jgi:hypothetical protein
MQFFLKRGFRQGFVELDEDQLGVDADFESEFSSVDL